EDRPLYKLRDYDHFWAFKKHYEIERERENLRKALFEKKLQELFHKHRIEDKREQEMILNKYKNTTLRTLNRRLFDELSNIERIVNRKVTAQINKLKRKAFERGELFKKY